ncbi:hypothetical protein HANVADRAFT_54927 [Hanseniaspora valbyensis NRRL Y-1626]|uniref:RTR1-type domain-containing protein n=1 Tax=Hanseniaspora valbyensis NRRL Y-1626 TaxID=766949 RepID=A0A1B7TIM4_9ASCO|nr:hypothetical protein HANVADRAFT_54927 [Hanseniaspora valbyensis NRRL Y-1626]
MSTSTKVLTYNSFVSSEIQELIKNNNKYKNLLLDLILHYADAESNSKDLNYLSRIIDNNFIEDLVIERNCNTNKCGYILCKEKISTRRNSTLLKTVDPYDNAKINWTMILKENPNDPLYYNKKFCSKTCYIKNNYMLLQIKDVDELLINRDYNSMISKLEEIAKNNENKIELWDDRLNEYDIIRRLQEMAIEQVEDAKKEAADVSMEDGSDEIIVKENENVTLFEHGYN